MSSNKIRILHLINGEHYSGAERVQDLLVQLLNRLDFDVYLACLKPALFPRACQCAPDRILYFAMGGRIDLRQAIKLALLVKKEDFKIIHTHTPRAAMVGCCVSFLSKVPMVHHVHSPTIRDSERVVRNKINALVERISVLRASRLIAVSNELRTHLLSQGINQQKIVVIHNGVDTSAPLTYRARPENYWRIGTIGLFRPRKGLESLLAALALLYRGKKYRFYLKIIGPFQNSRYEKKIHRLIQKLGLESVCKCVGFCSRKTIHAEFHQMDLFVLPSLFGEGVPMVILEAMAAGVPIISTNVGGIPEVIRNGIDGWLVRPNNVNELTETLREVMAGGKEWNTVRENAYQRQTIHFSAEQMAANTARLYQELLGR